VSVLQKEKLAYFGDVEINITTPGIIDEDTVFSP
jgi:hypothetical protein